MASPQKKLEQNSLDKEEKTPTLGRRMLNYVKSAIASRIATRAMSWALKNSGLSPMTEGIRGAYTSETDPNILRVDSEGKEVSLNPVDTPDLYSQINGFLNTQLSSINKIDFLQLEASHGQEHDMVLPRDMVDYLFASMPTSEEIDAARQRIARSDYNSNISMPPRSYLNAPEVKIPAKDLSLWLESLSRQSDGRGSN